jgi:UPF0716 family protein affecting phage T7 exclusion
LCLAASLQGWLRCTATVADRAMLMAAAVLFVVPSFVADAFALVLLATVYTLQSLRRTEGLAGAPVTSLD